MYVHVCMSSVKTPVWIFNTLRSDLRVYVHIVYVQVSISEDDMELHYGPVDYTDHLLELVCVVSSVDGENFFKSPPATLRVTG